MATATLQLYWDLASYDPKVRHSAAESLIRFLAEFQKNHEESLEDPSVKIANTEEELDVLCAPDVSYAIRRLIRGLPSSRQGARQGFSLALTELLAISNVITTKLALDILMKHTERTGGMTGEETRDMLFGRLFGLMSIVAAGMLTRQSTTVEDVKRIYDSLHEMAGVKAYLKEVCYHVVIKTIPNIKAAPYKEEALDHLLTTFLPDIANLDQLNLALAIQEHLPSVDLHKQFAAWKSPNVLDPANLPRLAKLLRETVLDENEIQVDWKPEPHSVWDTLLSTYLERPETNGSDESEELDRPKKKQRINKKGDLREKHHEEKASKASFEQFWSVVVDQTVFDQTASHGRKFWGFRLFEKVLPRLSPTDMPFVFTENFMRTFMNNLSSDVRFLNKAAKHTATVIEQVAQSNTRVGFALVTQLVGKHGHHNFDTKTHTRTVENILASMDSEGISAYLEFLAETFVKPSSETDESDVSREWALNQMSLLVTNGKIPKDEKWVTLLVKFLTVYAFFDISKSAKGPYFTNYHKPTPELSESVRKFCKARVQHVLVALSKMPPSNKVAGNNGAPLKTDKYNGMTNDGELWIYRVFEILQEFENDKALTSAVSLSEEGRAAYSKAVKLAKKLRKTSKEATDETAETGFEILLLQVALHMLINEEEAMSIMSELFDCHDKMFNKKKNKKNAKATEEPEPEPIDVLVDILVSFLTNDSPALKNVAEHVFEIFSHKATKQTLNVLLNILASGDNKHGADLFEDEEDDDVELIEGADDSDVEMIVDSDVEMIDADDAQPMDDDVRKKIEEAMKAEGILAGSDEDSSAEMDDDAMLAFDDKLAAVFKQKKLEKNEKRDMQHSIVHFKNNVMDFIIAYVRKNQSNPLVLEVILPLLNIIRSTSSKSVTNQFYQKVLAFLKNRLPKMNEYPKEHNDNIIDILQGVHDFAKQTTSKDLGDMAVELSSYLRKCILGGNDLELDDTLPSKKKEEIEKMTAVYNETLTNYLTKKSSHIHFSFFNTLFLRSPYSAWPMLPALVEYIKPTATANRFRHLKVCSWITLIVQRTVTKKSDTYNQKFLDIVPSIAKNIKETITATLSEDQGKSALDAETLKELIRFALTMIRIHKRVAKEPSEVAKVWEKETFSSISSKDKYKKPAIEKLCKQAIALLQQ